MYATGAKTITLLLQLVIGFLVFLHHLKVDYIQVRPVNRSNHLLTRIGSNWNSAENTGYYYAISSLDSIHQRVVHIDHQSVGCLTGRHILYKKIITSIRDIQL